MKKCHEMSRATSLYGINQATLGYPCPTEWPPHCHRHHGVPPGWTIRRALLETLQLVGTHVSSDWQVREQEAKAQLHHPAP
jgi:hypothetical protein